MMMVPVEIKKSEIHGMGIFAIAPIHKGQVLWMYSPAVDREFPEYAIKFAEPRTQTFIMERGYLNAEKHRWILPVDEGQFWNFPKRNEEANTVMGSDLDGEKVVTASRDIEVGEELLVPPESDADYIRKMESR